MSTQIAQTDGFQDQHEAYHKGLVDQNKQLADQIAQLRIDREKDRAAFAAEKEAINQAHEAVVRAAVSE